jgi:hypothetical protein
MYSLCVTATPPTAVCLKLNLALSPKPLTARLLMAACKMKSSDPYGIISDVNKQMELLTATAVVTSRC